MIDREKGYPFGGYIYDHGYYHSGPTWLNDEPALEAFMNTNVREAMKLKQEVRITDNGDYMIFHAVNGRIVWPSPDGKEPNDG